MFDRKALQKRKAAVERIAAVHAESHRRLLALRELLDFYDRRVPYVPYLTRAEVRRLKKIRVLAHKPQCGQQHGDRIKKGNGGAAMKRKAMKLVGVFILAGVCGCSLGSSGNAQRSEAPSNSSGPAGKKWTKADAYIDKETKIIKEHTAILVKEGKYGVDHECETPADYLHLGRYAWHGDGSGYFGAYSFHQPAFEQARHSWWLHAEVVEGSNELWAMDDNIIFDDSMVGYSVGPMNMTFSKNGKIQYVSFEGAKVIKVRDKHEAVLDKTAPHHAEQWRLGILPPDWIDMCACTNNFGPKFEDGHPVVEQ